MTIRALLLSTVLAASPALAAIDPPAASKEDGRIRSLVYEPNNPVEIYTGPGMSLRLEFGPGEEVVNNGIIVSDQDTISPDPTSPPPPPVSTVAAVAGGSQSGSAPEGGPSCDPNICRSVAGNIVYIKPIRALDPQPLFIQTKRTTAEGKVEMVPYTFEIFTKPVLDKDGKPVPMIWGVRFTYPNRVKEQQQAAWKAKQQTWVAQARDRASLAHPAPLAAPGPTDNVRYGYRGSPSLQPDKPWDDGRTTFLRYNGNRRLPNVYTRTPDGKETIANSAPEPDANGNTIRIAGTGQKWFLRDGDEAGCLFDLGPDPQGRTATTIAQQSPR